jgi:ribosomal protein S18 acetylase RimI-like enzyme
MPPKPAVPPRVLASHVQAAVSRHAPVTQAKPRVSPVAPPRTAAPSGSAQARTPVLSPQPDSFRIVTSNPPGGARQIRIADGSRQIGSVEVLEAGRDAVRVVNLKVDPDQRGHGAGAQLMRAAAFEGLRMGRTRMTLESQDNGSGKLTRWYAGMGFMPRGRNDRGMVVLETSAISLQSQLARRRG